MKRWCGVFLVVSAMACSEYNREAVQDNNSGMGLMRQGRLTDARDKFQRAADADPKFVSTSPVPEATSATAPTNDNTGSNPATRSVRSTGRGPRTQRPTNQKGA